MNEQLFKWRKQQRKEAVLTRDAALELSLLFDTSHANDMIKAIKFRDELELYLNPKTIRQLADRAAKMGPHDRKWFQDLVDCKAHWIVLAQFLACNQHPGPQNRPTRDQIFRAFQERLHQQKHHGFINVFVRAVVPTLFVGMVSSTVAATLTSAALVSNVLPHEYFEPAHRYVELATPLLAKVLEEAGGFVSLAGLVAAGWFAWNHASRVLPDLKTTMHQPETEILDALFGPDQQKSKLHLGLHRLQDEDRHLLGHLTPIELRFFLRGSDKDRKDILKRHPPPLLAEVKYVLAKNPPGWVNYWRASVMIATICLPSTWRSGWFRVREFELSERLQRWSFKKPITSVQANPINRVDKKGKSSEVKTIEPNGIEPPIKKRLGLS